MNSDHLPTTTNTKGSYFQFSWHKSNTEHNDHSSTTTANLSFQGWSCTSMAMAARRPLTPVFLNRCAAAHLCAVSSFQVCRKTFFPYFFWGKNHLFVYFRLFLVWSVPPNFFLTLVCRELKKVENHCLTQCVMC